MSQRAKGKDSRRGAATKRPGSNNTAGAKASLPEAPSHPRWLLVAVCLFLAVLVWAVFGQTLHYGFINFDDDQQVYENPIILQGLNWHGIVQLFTHIDATTSDWWPVNELSHMLDWQFYGPNAGGHHLTNVLLHAATVILLFLTLLNLTGTLWRSAFVAAIFAIHPLRVESVAWVSERKDVLSGLFFMLTLWSYVQYVRQFQLRSSKAGIWYGLALGLFALGLMSKSMLVTLPFVLLLLDWWPLDRIQNEKLKIKNCWRLLLEKIPFLLLTTAACAVTILAQRHTNIESVQGVGLFGLAVNGLVAYVVYLGHMVYPVGLVLVYSMGTRSSLWMMAGALLVLILISVGAMAGRRKHPYLLVGWLWYLGMLVPVIMMQAGICVFADRYTYLPQIGLYILITWGAVELYGNWRHRRAVLGSAAVATLAVLLALARVQTAHWKDSISLWTHTLACASGNPLAHYNLGIALASQGKVTEAMQHYERALQLKPDIADAHINLGIALAGQGKVTEAMQHYERALQLEPDYPKANNNLGIALASQGKLAEAMQHYVRALELKPYYAEAHDSLGIALASQGKVAEAVQHYERALELKPDYAEAHNNLGITLASQGKLAEAMQHYKRALELKPDYAEAHNNLGNALASQGKLVEAMQQYEWALQFKPDYAEAHNNLGNTLASQGKAAEAVQHYERALQLKPDYAEAHNNLGITLTDQGKPAEAMPHFQQALILATAQNKPALVETIRARLNSIPPAVSSP
jgi:tetratricopeptide (TPR) repeat protein